jgi:hypothetical protein
MREMLAMEFIREKEKRIDGNGLPRCANLLICALQNNELQSSKHQFESPGLRLVLMPLRRFVPKRACTVGTY